MDVSEDEVKELTQQFYVTLRGYVARLTSEDEARSPKSFKAIEDILNGDRHTWSDAYEIEQLIVDLFDEHTLEVELRNRLLEADSTLAPALAGQYAKLAATLTAPEDRRALLARMVNDLQWRYTVNEVKRTYSKDVTRTTAMIFIATIAVFAAFVVARTVMVRTAGALPDAGDVSLLLVAALAGGWGAGFSMLSGLKSRLDAADLDGLKVMRSRWILWSRPLIGVGAASILYFFMMSGLLGGAAIPNFSAGQGSDGQATTAVDTAGAAGTGTVPAPQSQRAQLALLIVWCFLAGFSERLVPALLAKTEGGSSGQSSIGPDRFRPEPAQQTGEGDSQTAAKAPTAPAASPATSAPSGA